MSDEGGGNGGRDSVECAAADEEDCGAIRNGRSVPSSGYGKC